MKISGIDKIKDNEFLGIASVSGVTDPIKTKSGKNYLEDLGFKLLVSDNIEDRFRYMAGDDKLRLESLEKLILNSDVGGVIFSRGGYGAIRLLDLIDFDIFKNCTKLIIGYSDNSILLNIIYEKSGLKTLHGPNLSEMEKIDGNHLKRIFNCEIDRQLFKSFSFLKNGYGEGPLKGGNLASLASLCGTSFFPDLDGTIFFIEDINEPPYKIDRYLAQLKACKKLKNISGVLVGDFVNCGENSILDEIMLEYFKLIPIVKTKEFGHGELNNPLVVGAKVIIDSKKNMVCYG